MTQAYSYLAIVVSCLLVREGMAQLRRPSECGNTKGCFPICPNGDNDCKAVATWSADGDSVTFELHLRVTGTQPHWIALGLSSDTSMGSDSVTECFQTTAGAGIAKSFNNGNANDAVVSSGITLLGGSFNGGVLTCRYQQTVANSDAQIYDLNTDWHLLIAYGLYDGSKRPHETAGEGLPSASANVVDLQSNEVVGEAKEVKVKVHGALMMFGWMFCASIGIVLARFFKPMFPQSTLCKEKVWFAWHRMLMITCFLVVAAGFILIFEDVRGWAHLDGHTKWQKAHPYIGCVVTGFVVLNPIMALFRPHPDSENRYLFNWFHWLVGTCAHILSAMAIILGVTLGKSSVPFYVVWIVLGWAAYQAVIVLIMEMHECAIVDVASKYKADGSMKSPPGRGVKVGFLVFHILVITAVTAVCIVLVAIN